jgi:hypothetical protein
MPQEIKIWKVQNKKLKEIRKERLDFEKRLEDWIEDDITILSDDLIIIGRQISTDFGGSIDLLCIDSRGDLVVVELKRDKTPREITSQVLDYASWIKDLSNDRIHEIANNNFKGNKTLDEIFKEKFDFDLPEILNEHHKMLIVASEIDLKSERIVKYLSNSYGVNINIATFQYFKNEGGEFLAKVFLIKPEEAEYRTQTKTGSKRKPPLTFEELEEIAEGKGIKDLYLKLVKKMERRIDYKSTTRSSLAFYAIFKEGRRTIFSIIPKESSSQKGVLCEIREEYFLRYFKIKFSELENVFKSSSITGENDGKSIRGYLKGEDSINNFISILENK